MTRRHSSIAGSRPRSLRCLVCPTAFKGSLDASAAARAIRDGLLHAVAEVGIRITTDVLPVADGGDGTLDALVTATSGAIHMCTVRGPLGRSTRARWGRLGANQKHVAVIEAAEACGLRLLRPGELDAGRASTFGVGQLMRATVQAGCRTLIVGLGGSATTDGGAGMAQALGFRLLDDRGRDLAPGGAELSAISTIRSNGAGLGSDIRVIALCDVDNPLAGAHGAAVVYGPQKGASPEMVDLLDAALTHYADVVKRQLGVDVLRAAGAGAAGGLGAGMMAFCHADLQPGADVVLDTAGFDARLAATDLVITGEGRIDAQTVHGKLVQVVARRAAAAGVPVIALAGDLVPEAEQLLRECGLSAVLPLPNGPITRESAMDQVEPFLRAAAARAIRLALVLHDTGRGRVNRAGNAAR